MSYHMLFQGQRISIKCRLQVINMFGCKY